MNGEFFKYLIRKNCGSCRLGSEVKVSKQTPRCRKPLVRLLLAQLGDPELT